jgi:hypothetical protein
MGKPASILIDSGSGGNIVAKKFLSNKENKFQSSDYEVIYPNGTKQVVENLPCQKFNIGEYEDKLDFFVVDLQSKKFDIILGKPWLVKYNPMINWETHCISFMQGEKKHHSESRVNEINRSLYSYPIQESCKKGTSPLHRDPFGELGCGNKK